MQLHGVGYSDRTAGWAAVGGIGFHSSFPRFKRLAFYLGFEGGASHAVPFIFSVRPGLRFTIVRGLAIGLFPVSPTLLIDHGPGRHSGIEAPTSLEVLTTF